MKKLLQTIFIISLFSVSAFAQINGSTTVCAGYTYSYTVSILNASTFTWTLPIGWYDVTGQGTSQINGTCNVHDGVITVEGFNPNGISVGVETINVQFSAGGGWSLNPSSVYGCAGQTSTSTPINVVTNGTGGGPGCPSGCGTGTPNADIDFVMYDGLWPACNFVAVCPGLYMMPFQASTYYVYKVDHTAGFTPGTQAILINGSCGGAVVNNTVDLFPSFPMQLNFTQSPLPACVSDTVEIGVNLGSFLWNSQFHYGTTLLMGSNPANFIVDSINAMIDVTGLDWGGCFNGAPYTVITDSCITTGLHEQSIAQNISVTPNPATDFILVKTKYNTPFALQVYNALGQIVFENKNVVQQINIPVKNFAKGVYTVKAGNAVQRFWKD